MDFEGLDLDVFKSEVYLDLKINTITWRHKSNSNFSNVKS